ncbi:hypothetical protein V5F49_15800 [Xanthobacter sp. V3C-3]|uniref:hypothetical protein n=1 Tax=Xanthobacter lutulentifluminis TaxID=3119935 RepID=UPI003726915D
MADKTIAAQRHETHDDASRGSGTHGADVVAPPAAPNEAARAAESARADRLVLGGLLALVAIISFAFLAVLIAGQSID